MSAGEDKSSGSVKRPAALLETLVTTAARPPAEEQEQRLSCSQEPRDLEADGLRVIWPGGGRNPDPEAEGVVSVVEAVGQTGDQGEEPRCSRANKLLKSQEHEDAQALQDLLDLQACGMHVRLPDSFGSNGRLQNRS